jgi:Holliday junction resolvase RusA-like endonuclease
MAPKEKGRPAGGDPIPNIVRQDKLESISQRLDLQEVSQTAAPITIALRGQPQGKGRARAFVRGGRVGHYTPEKTCSYEGLIRAAAMDELAGRLPFDEPVEFVLRAVFPVPASWSKRKQQMAMTGEIKPGKKPDLDNLGKVWSDALNGVAYREDALICRMTLEKRYGPQPLVVVTVRPVDGAVA